MLMFGCSSDLPPEPGDIGIGESYDSGNGKTGMAYYRTYEGYAPPVDIFDDDNLIYFLDPVVVDVAEGESNFYLDISVSHEDSYVYKYGHVYIPTLQTWRQFSFDEKTVTGSNWIREDADTTLMLDKADFISGENYIVTYSCKKHNNEWKCGCSSESQCDMWMLQNFLYRNVDLPPEPDKPGEIYSAKVSLNPLSGLYRLGQNVSIDAYVEASNDISEYLSKAYFTIQKSDGDVEIIQPESSDITDCYYCELCKKYHCYASFSANYPIIDEGKYNISLVIPNLNNLKMSSGRFIVDEKIFNNIIEEDIGDMLFENSHGYLSGNGLSVTASYRRYNPHIYSDVSFSNSDEAINRHEDLSSDWSTIVINGNKIKTFEENSCNTNYNGDTVCWNRKYYSWFSGGNLIVVYMSSDENVELGTGIVEAYLEIHPGDDGEDNCGDGICDLISTEAMLVSDVYSMSSSVVPTGWTSPERCENCAPWLILYSGAEKGYRGLELGYLKSDNVYIDRESNNMSEVLLIGFGTFDDDVIYEQTITAETDQGTINIYLPEFHSNRSDNYWYYVAKDGSTYYANYDGIEPTMSVSEALVLEHLARSAPGKETSLSCPEDCASESCTDSDGGKNYYEKGYIHANFGHQHNIDREDRCAIITQGSIEEGSYYSTYVGSCGGNNCYIEEHFINTSYDYCAGEVDMYNCPNGCKDGACVNETVPEGQCCYFESSGSCIGILDQAACTQVGGAFNSIPCDYVTNCQTVCCCNGDSYLYGVNSGYCTDILGGTSNGLSSEISELECSNICGGTINSCNSTECGVNTQSCIGQSVIDIASYPDGDFYYCWADDVAYDTASECGISCTQSPTADCTSDSPITSECLCNGQVYTSGYCCFDGSYANTAADCNVGNVEYVYKENSDTYSIEPSYLYLDYVKVDGALSAIWQVKHGGRATYNVSIPDSCFIYYSDKISLRFYTLMNNVVGDGLFKGSYGECFNGSWTKITNNGEYVQWQNMPGVNETSLIDGDWSTAAFYGRTTAIDEEGLIWRKCNYGLCREASIYEEGIWFKI